MKTVLITGVSGGMGFQTAKRLTENGYKVYGIDIKAPGEMLPGLSFVQTDLTDEASVCAAFQQIRSETAELDGIIHMAGMYDLNSLVEMSDDEFTRIFQINLFGMFRVNKAFLPAMKKGSRIIIVSSELAPLDPLPFTGIYGITKTAVEQYAFSLRKELQLLDIKVIVLRPGAVDTGLLNVSTSRLTDFCSNTQLYSYNAKRFRNIVDRVESRKILPERMAGLALKALTSKRPRLIYKINRNPLLILLNILPDRLQDYILKKILTVK